MGKEDGVLKNNASIEDKGGMKLDSRKNKKSKGQAFAEMALILPLLLLLVISSIELGRVFYAKIVITNAAREGVYYLSLHRDDSNDGFANTIQTVKDEANNSGLALATSDITPSICSTCTDTAIVTVNTSIKDLLLINLINGGFGIKANRSDFTVSSTVEMAMQ